MKNSFLFFSSLFSLNRPRFHYLKIEIYITEPVLAALFRLNYELFMIKKRRGPFKVLYVLWEVLPSEMNDKSKVFIYMLLNDKKKFHLCKSLRV